MRSYEAVGTLHESRFRARSRQGLRSQDHRARRFAAILLLALAAIALVSMGHLRSAFVNGSRVRIGRNWKVEDCARAQKLSLQPGNLLSVGGAVLRAGGGAPAAFWVNGTPAAPDTHVRRGDNVLITPAGDAVEPTEDIVTYTDAPQLSLTGQVLRGTSSSSFVRGIRRLERGLYSGEVVADETAFASAQINRTAATVKRPKAVAFTFDDGPNEVWTPRVLDTLRANDAKGTFFVLGQAVKPVSGMFRRIIAEGHEVGTHSWHHDSFTRLTDAAIASDLGRCLKVMREEGATVRCFRPPYGAHDSRVDAAAKRLGLHVILWDVDPFDWKRPGADVIYSRVMKSVRDKAIILMHDGPTRREQTLAALQQLLPALRKQGYEFLTVSELKGFAPLYTGVVHLTVGGTTYRLAPLPVDMKVTVDTAPLALSSPVLRCGTEMLVPARAFASALGAAVEYQTATEQLIIRGTGGNGLLRLDSTRCEVDGVAVNLAVPPALYANQAYVPLSLLKRLCTASCVYDEGRHVLTIRSLSGA
jgi:peptidoglycan/xylan/chitin deacetylase (PgdA/CDA1 family)